MFEVKIEESIAIAEVNAFMDKKVILPKRRQQLEAVVEAVVEGIMLGYIAINEDTSIEQTLIKPAGELTTIKYAARVAPEVMSKRIADLKTDNQTNRTLEYQKAYTGLLGAQIQKLEPADRNLADCIALFFQ